MCNPLEKEAPSPTNYIPIYKHGRAPGSVPSPWSYRSGGSGCRSPGPCLRPCDADCRWSRPPAPGSHPSHSPGRHLLPWNTQEEEVGLIIGQRLYSTLRSVRSTMSRCNMFYMNSQTNKSQGLLNSNIVTFKEKIWHLKVPKPVHLIHDVGCVRIQYHGQHRKTF